MFSVVVPTLRRKERRVTQTANVSHGEQDIAAVRPSLADKSRVKSGVTLFVRAK